MTEEPTGIIDGRSGAASSPPTRQASVPPDAGEPGYTMIVGTPAEMLGITIPEPPAEKPVTDATVAADLAKVGDAVGVAAPTAADGLPPYIDATQPLGIRNGRELAHWIRGRLDPFGAEASVHVRIPVEHLGAISAVLIEDGYAVAPHSGIRGEQREATIEVSPIPKVVSLHTAFSEWRDGYAARSEAQVKQR